jgi:alpha-L-rhamnosidase
MNQLERISILGAVTLAMACQASVEVEHLRCEYLANPRGIDAAKPRLSWMLESSRRGEKQTGYQVLVASSPRLLDREQGDLWDSGKVASSQNTQVVYLGQELTSREACFWKVRVWDRDGKASGWSDAARWEMGLLKPADWSAQWIAADAPVSQPQGRLVILKATFGSDQTNRDVTELLAGMVQNNRLELRARNSALGGDPAKNQPKRLVVEYEFAGARATREVSENHSLALPSEAVNVKYLRKGFALKPGIQQATLYATALGLYEARLNGQRVGDQVLAPDWTDYRKRARYQAYDVTKRLAKGENVIAAVLANGWYGGHIGNGGYQYFGKSPAFLAQLEVTYKDGSVERVVTDGSWRSVPGPIQASDFMLGETYDASLEIPGWDKPGFVPQLSRPVDLREVKGISLDAQVMEPVREICELKPKSVMEIRPGRYIFDLGQNMVGVARLKVSAPVGTEVILRHAEMLNPDGTLYTTNLRGAPSVDHYICKGRVTEVWQPEFTFHGFRYVELSGLPERPGLDAVTGVVLASDTPPTGRFECSDSRINQLQRNIQWGQRGNYLSVPTDCPQRDERLGWMGDAQVFVRTATYNANVAAFFNKWLVDVDDAQNAAGSFSDVSPDVMGVNGVPAWGDAGVICPWTIYEAYGDQRVLENHLPAMKRWIDYLQQHSTGLIRDKDRGNDYGDWLSIGAKTPKDLIGTAYFAYSTRLVARSCRVLGRDAEAEKYEKLFGDIRQAFIQRYVAADGRIKGDTQCGYAMALKFELLPDELRPKAAQYLEEDVRAKGNHLSTGFVGVSYLLPVLTEAGKADTAYRLLLQDTFPSWLFSVRYGATTIWERWDGWTPDKGFQDPGMNSFNHYSLGSCGEYLFGYVGGIRPFSPGYQTIAIAPVVGDGLSWAKTSYQSMQGEIATAWKKEGNSLVLEVTVPANTTARVRVPSGTPEQVTEGGKPLAKVPGIHVLRQESDSVTVEIGSGTYRFASGGRG